MAKQAFVKGQEVVLFGDWDQKGTCYARKLTVQSCGAKRMTCFDTNESKMVSCFIYAEEYNVRVFPATDFANDEAIIAKALEFAAEFIQKSLAHNEGKVGNMVFHQPSVLANVDFFKTATPVAEFHPALLATIRAKFA